MNPVFRSMLRTAMAKAGIEVRRVGGAHPFKAGSTTRPIGKVGEFLEDIRARGFFPKGIIDVGANAGDWSRLALSIFPEAPLIMIEPQKEMESCLRRFSNARVNCHYVKAGAGREVGEEVQTIWPDFAGSSFLPEADEKKI